MKAFIRLIKKYILRIVLFPIRLIPIKKNQITLINDLGYNYSCNPKALTEYYLHMYEGLFEIYYSVKNPQKYKNYEKSSLHFVKFNSFTFFYYAMTSKVVISNSGGYSYLPLRKKTYVINTHHGGGAYKKCGLEMFGNSWVFRKDLLLSARNTNCFLSTNKKFTEVVSRDCLMDKKVFWEIGMPRNDMLIHKNKQFTAQVKKHIGLRENDKLVLFAPTYRKYMNNYFNSSIAIDYGIDVNRVLEALTKRFGGNWIFGYRFHPTLSNIDIGDKNTINLSNYEDMQDLLLATDVLINDFSSSMWDYLLTNNPCFIFAKDLKEYVQTTKVYTPVEEWPFPIATNNDELFNNIVSFDEETYRKKCKHHYDELGGCETGEATKLVWEKIIDLCGIEVN